MVVRRRLGFGVMPDEAELPTLDKRDLPSALAGRPRVGAEPPAVRSVERAGWRSGGVQPPVDDMSADLEDASSGVEGSAGPKWVREGEEERDGLRRALGVASQIGVPECASNPRILLALKAAWLEARTENKRSLQERTDSEYRQ